MHGFQLCRYIERIIADGGNGFGNGITCACFSLRISHKLRFIRIEQNTVLATEILTSLAYGKALQRRTNQECFIFNISYTGGNMELCKTVTIRKGVGADIGDAFGQCNVCQFATIKESEVADAGDAFFYFNRKNRGVIRIPRYGGGRVVSLHLSCAADDQLAVTVQCPRQILAAAAGSDNINYVVLYISLHKGDAFCLGIRLCRRTGITVNSQIIASVKCRSINTCYAFRNDSADQIGVIFEGPCSDIRYAAGYGYRFDKGRISGEQMSGGAACLINHAAAAADGQLAALRQCPLQSISTNTHDTLVHFQFADVDPIPC